MKPKGYVTITVKCDLRELRPSGSEFTDRNSYIIRWIGGENKIITAPTFSFATDTMAQALNDVAVLCALNPFITEINLKTL